MNEQLSENTKEIWTPSQQNISQWMTQSNTMDLNKNLFEDLKIVQEEFEQKKPNGTNFRELMARMKQLTSKHNPNRKIAALLRAKE
jgi:cell fate (sporulation/competence/biofilm development) regulator YlbF (YheA/YmcA/DUF963 family)